MLHTTSDTVASVTRSCDTKDGSEITRKTAKDILTSSQLFLDSGPEAFKEVSPLVLQCPYRAATVYIRMIHENPTQESLDALRTLKRSLKVKTGIWKVAGEQPYRYLSNCF